ncbi:MAG: DegV family EDD domain-containing protein [Oscillospiraceae bacterium]|nr:DegV family EDD domain-containing protein [Oscillospiraceae bacterium]
MNLKKLLMWLPERGHNAKERIFITASLPALAAVIIFTLEEAVLSDSWIMRITGLGGVLCFGLVIWLCIRYRKPRLGGTIISIGMGVVLFPANFYWSGGFYGCAPLWFVNFILYVSLVLSGRARRFMLAIGAVIAGVCYYVAYAWPELLRERTSDYIFRTSALSVILVSWMVFAMVDFGVRVLNEENRRSRKQAKEIAELNTAQNRFFSSMSHEIRTPINTIIGLNEMILRENVSDEVREDAENIQSASKMLLQVINDILDMSKFESGQMELAPASYRTGDMLSEVVGMFWNRAKEKNLEFRVDVAPDIPEELYGDEVRIKQILINVINNAIKYTSEGSVALQIQCERREDNAVRVIYTVSDTGVGIKKESLPYLFTAFKRVDEEKNRHIEGTGLGLSIVKNLVDLMGGTISVNSVYTKGSTFVIELPQTVVSDRPIGEIGSGERHIMGEHDAYHQSFEAPGAKVLVVDDTAANLLVVKKLLRDTKVQLTTAGSGREALEKTLDTAFHVILMDHMMPEMDGIECLHRIRTQTGGVCGGAKIIALTANAGGDLKAMYAKEGFDGYLIKPVSGRDLERELYHALPKDLVRVTGKSDSILEESMAWINEHQKKIPVAVTTESVADLPQLMRNRHGIDIIPHMVSTKDGIFRDGIEIDTRGLLEYMEDDDAIVADRAPDASDYERFFAQALQGANNVVHISITSKVQHSGCHTAMEAAESFDNVYVVDSGHLSSGQGLMTLEASRLAEEGRSAAEIVLAMKEVQSRIKTSFIVENTDYLARANQISRGLALLAKAFMMHPVISLKNGKMVAGRVCFGRRETVWKKYIGSAFNIFEHIDRRYLFITYVGLSQRELEQIRETVSQHLVFEHVIFQEASPAIAVNCGPGTFGLLFMTEG